MAVVCPWCLYQEAPKVVPGAVAMVTWLGPWLPGFFSTELVFSPLQLARTYR